MATQSPPRGRSAATTAESSALLSIEEAAEYLGGLSKSYIYGYLLGREIPRTRVGRRVMVSRAALDAFIARNTDALG